MRAREFQGFVKRIVDMFSSQAIVTLALLRIQEKEHKVTAIMMMIQLVCLCGSKLKLLIVEKCGGTVYSGVFFFFVFHTKSGTTKNDKNGSSDIAY